MKEIYNEKEFDELKEKLSECVMTDEAVRIITEAGVSCKVFPKMASLIKENMEKYEKGKIIKGQVTGIEKYGIFVSLDEFYSGLIHISEINDKLSNEFRLTVLFNSII